MNIRFNLVSMSVFSTLILSGCSIVGDRHVQAGEVFSRELSTVAGSVHVEEGAVVHGASTVAGNIRIDNTATTGSLKTTAGNVEVGRSVTVNGSIRSTAGNIAIGTESKVHGDVINVAGEVTLNGCHVVGRLRSTHGDINVNASVIEGGILVKRKDGINRKWINITIGPGSTVSSIDASQATKVSIRISREATVGKVTGVEPEYF